MNMEQLLQVEQLAVLPARRTDMDGFHDVEIEVPDVAGRGKNELCFKIAAARQ